MNTQRIMLESELTAKRITKIKAFLNDAPEGHLERNIKGNTVYYMVSSFEQGQRSRSYLPSSENSEVMKYIKKKYYLKLLPKLETNLKSMEHMLGHYDPNPEQSVLMTLPDWMRKPIKADSKTDRDKYIENWISSPFVSNPFHTEKRKIETLHGEFVRSKTEREIANALHRKGLAYRYDCEVKLADGIVYADFVILHPVTLEEYYWEHSGMLGDPSYTQANYDRLGRYARSGILVGERLIITGENNEHILSSQAIERLIEAYFGV